MNQKKTKSVTATSGKGQFLVYSTEDGEIKIDVRLENETVWVTQADMAKLFQCSTDNISLHLKNIYDDGELQVGATTEDFSVVRKEGGRDVQRNLAFYNLDAIISAGYRIKSAVATPEEWTNEILNIKTLNRNEVFLRFMATKSTHWAYEKEWRCLDQKRPTDNGDHEICAIHPEEIEAIYLGCRMPENNKRAITDCVFDKLSHVEIYEAQQHAERYQLTFNLRQSL